MLLSDILGTTVSDERDHHLGAVRDVRLIQDGKQLDELGRAFRIQGIIVERHRVGRSVGLERIDVKGPWVIKKLYRFLNRETFFVEWDDVVTATRELVTIKKPQRPRPPEILSRIPNAEGPAGKKA